MKKKATTSKYGKNLLAKVPVTIIRKEIGLGEDVIERLEAMAKLDSRKLKPYMEIVLTNHAKNSTV